jgi:tetratricopeptide (TPR) repeat protein
MRSHYRFGVLMCAFLAACGGEQAKPTLTQTSASGAAGAKKPTPVVKKLTQPELDAVLVTARDLVAAGDLGNAERTLETALLQESNDDFVYSVRYNLGVLSERKGDYSKAMRHFEKAQILKPELGAPVLALAQLYVRQGQVSAGIELARNALRAHPKSTSLRNSLNRLLVINRQDLEAVIKTSKKILVQDENNAEAMLNLAIAYQSQARHDMAIDVLNRAEADFEGLRPDLLWRKAKSYLALELVASAREVLTKAIATPETATPELHNMLGLLDLQTGNSEAAEANFRAAIKYSPDMISACVNLSHALKASQKYDDALSTLNSCSDRSGGQVDMLYNLGILYLDGKFTRIKGLKQVERAKTYFQEFLDKSNDPERKKLAMTYLGESDKRIKYENKKIELKARAKKREEARKAREAAEVTTEEVTDQGTETSTTDDDGTTDSEGDSND